MDLEACPFCGAELDGQPDFCPACDRFLWESLEPTPPPAAMNAGESAPRLPSNPSKKGRRSPAETDQVPTLGVAERHVAVDPGDTQAVVVSILNTGSRVDEVDIVVDPPVAAFASVEPTVVNVYPQDKAEARVTFAPPPDPRIPAGTRVWTIRATSRVSGQEASVSGTVDVLAFTAEEATLEPRQSTGWRRDFEHSVVLDNRGNAPWVVVLEPARSERVSLTADPVSVTIPAGAVGAATILGRAQRRFVGTGESIPLHLEVVSETGSGPARRSIPLEATRHQRALLPPWLLTAAVVVIGLALAAYAVFGNSADEGGTLPLDPEPAVVRVPSVESLSAARATAILELAGFAVDPQSVQSSLKAGAAIETSPAEGQTAAEGSTVILFFSAGSDEEKIQVPAVVALTADEAQRRLWDLGLSPRIELLFSDDVPAGSVIRSEPAAPADVDPGSEVVIFVSDGPEVDPPTAIELPDPGFDPVVSPLDPDRDVVAVTGIRIGQHAEFDRLVIDLTAPVDGFTASYQGFISVDIERATADAIPLTRTGWSHVTDYSLQSSGDRATVEIGRAGFSTGPFRAYALPAEPALNLPDRLVVDVFHVSP